MAYNPYQYPYYQYSPTPQTPQQTYYQLPQQTSNGSLLTVFIDREEDVNDYPVAAGTTVQLISFKLGKFYLKSTGTNGVPQPIRVFTFSEATPKSEIQNGQVTRDEFNALSSKIDKLLKELGGES